MILLTWGQITTHLPALLHFQFLFEPLVLLLVIGLVVLQVDHLVGEARERLFDPCVLLDQSVLLLEVVGLCVPDSGGELQLVSEGSKIIVFPLDHILQLGNFPSKSYLGASDFQ